MRERERGRKLPKFSNSPISTSARGRPNDRDQRSHKDQRTPGIKDHTKIKEPATYLTNCAYWSSPFSFHFLYMTDASTLAGDEVFGSLSNEITESRIVLESIENQDIKLETHWISSFSPVPDFAMVPAETEGRSYRFQIPKSRFTIQVPDALSRVPPFTWQFATLWIIDRRVKDTDAQITVLK